MFRRKRTSALVSLAAVAALALAGCGSDDDKASDETAVDSN